MKISGVKVFQVTANDSDRQEIYVRIETDTNLTGLYGPINAEQAFIIHNRFAALLSGRDPLATEDLWEDMRRVDRHARAGHMMMAISAIDNALWDIRGKHYSQPVFKLLGGSRREIITTYASMLGYSVEPAEAAQKARQMYDQGFTAQKWFFKYAPSDGKKGMLKNLAMVEALRTELGPEATLMFDALWQWDVPYAMEMARDMMPYKPTWLEEPLHPEQIEGYKRIKDQTGIPLAAGEHFYTRWNVKPFLDAKCLDYIQTDPDWCGGITELVKICALADVYDVKVIPHGHHVLAAIHAVASQPERLCPMAECLMKRHIEAMQYFHKTPIKAQNGQIKLPEAPGLGFELDNKKIKETIDLKFI